MKPEALRQRRQQAQEAKQTRADMLDTYMRGGNPSDVVQPDLIPTDADRVAALREYRTEARLAAGERLGSDKRSRLLDRALAALAAVVYVDRVLALDRLERASLTPARLRSLSMVGPLDLNAKMSELQRGERNA